MRSFMIGRALTLGIVIGSLVFAVVGQERKKVSAQGSKPIIFAVLNDGKVIEPIAHVEKGKLTSTVGGDAEIAKKKVFAESYFKAKPVYRLIFGGKENGVVRVESFNPEADCSSNLAQVFVTTKRVNLRGFVMGLSTDVKSKKAGSGIRRLPTGSERNEINILIMKEFAKNKVNKDLIPGMKYHNLTALDVDNDGTAELVGTFFVETAAKERALLFFIAQKAKSGKFYFSHADFKKVGENEVLSGEISALDDGINNELLLDVFDYDDDGVSEIFTLTQGFEGNTFNVYKREGPKWSQVFSESNYHCGY